MSWVELEDEFVTLWVVVEVVVVVQEIYSSSSSLKGSFVERGKKGSKVVMQLKNPMNARTTNTK
jgi:DNA integrity scanning protein DisA with diadenylate cyclase activity